MNLSASRLIVLPHASAYRRLIGITAGVAVATAMLLILLGTYLHLPDREDRTAWLDRPQEVAAAPGVDGTPIPQTDDGVLVSAEQDFAADESFFVVRLAATPATSVEMPGGLIAPQPGEYYASPALQRLIESMPDDELRDRYGTFVGYLPDSTLKGSTQLAAMVGMSWDEVAARPASVLVTEFNTQGTRGESIAYRVIIAIGAIALLVPIVLLVGIVSQLGAADRRERFATVRLIGAGRKHVARLSALEMGLATLVGSMLGLLVMVALRPAAALIRFGGTQSFTADLTPPAGPMFATVFGVAALGAGSAWWRTYRDDVGALSSTRERAEKRATALRIGPLLLGLGALSIAVFGTETLNTQFLILSLVGGFALVAFGVIFAGSYLTRVLASWVRKLSHGAASLVAAGRLARHPRATFRSVAGLVVAVFIVSMFAGLSSVAGPALSPRPLPGSLPMGTVVAELDTQSSELDAAVTRLDGIDGVTDVVVAGQANGRGFGELVVTTSEARALGAHDVPDAALVVLDGYSMIMAGVNDWLPTPPEEFTGEAPPPGAILVVTDGERSSVERARTALVASGVSISSPTTRADQAGGGDADIINELAIMAYIGMGIAVAISAVALAVATIASALDRKRTFGLLRLAGMPVKYLRRVIATEAAVPLGGMLAWSAGLGFLVAWMLIEAIQAPASMQGPDARYWISILAAVAIGALAISSSFGMVRRSTEVASTRFE